MADVYKIIAELRAEHGRVKESELVLEHIRSTKKFDVFAALKDLKEELTAVYDAIRTFEHMARVRGRSQASGSKAAISQQQRRQRERTARLDATA